jgi:hypothetical protein
MLSTILLATLLAGSPDKPELMLNTPAWAFSEPATTAAYEPSMPFMVEWADFIDGERNDAIDARSQPFESIDIVQPLTLTDADF